MTKDNGPDQKWSIPPYLKHLLGNHCVFQVAISGGDFFKKIGASHNSKKRNGRYKESAYLDFQDMTGVFLSTALSDSKKSNDDSVFCFLLISETFVKARPS